MVQPDCGYHDESRGQGYSSLDFAESFEEFGEPCKLGGSGGFVIVRSIPCRTEAQELYYDAIGPYPFLIVKDLNELHADLHSLALLKNGLVSFTAVLDPFTAAYYFSGLPDIQKRINFLIGTTLHKFKPHVIVHVSTGKSDYSAHHSKRVEKAAKNGLHLCYASNQSDAAEAWKKMQRILNYDKQLTGVKRMSDEMIEKQVCVENLDVLCLYDNKEHDNLLGVSTWVTQNKFSFSHTTAMTKEGRKALAGYAMYDHAIQTLPLKYTDLSYIDLGSYASVKSINPKTIDGLSFFKMGWSSTRLYSYLMTSILNKDKYAELQATTNTKDVTKYFPAYRNGEML